MTAPSPIPISSDVLDIQVLAQGAALVGVRFRGQTRNHVLGFADPADHQRLPVFAGALVGPVANRIRKGQIRINGRTYQMPRNEAGRTTLHSGPAGLHAQHWTLADRHSNWAEFNCHLPDGACGLPGNRDISARYLVEGSTLTLEITARSDRATPMNIAAHPYWNLDGTKDLSGHKLSVAAETFLPTDKDHLPTGAQAPVEGTMFDFRTMRPVPPTPALDVNFCLQRQSCSTPQPAAVLQGADGTTLQIDTTAPGLQVYNGAHLPNVSDAMGKGRDLAPYCAIALEPQYWPDAPSHPGFPSILLQPGDIYRQTSRFTLTPAHVGT